MLFKVNGCLVQSPLLAFIHFNDSEAVFLHVISSRFISVLVSYYHVEHLLQWKMDVFLDKKKSDKSSPWPQTQCCNEKKSYQYWSSQFFPSAFCIAALDFANWSCSLKKGYDHIFKATGLVLPRFEPTCLMIKITKRMKTVGLMLTHQIWM